MGFFDRLFGDEEQQQTRTASPSAPRSQDDIAIERYRYLLRTAPRRSSRRCTPRPSPSSPPQQRQQVYEELKNNSGETPAGDDLAVARPGGDPR